MALIRCTVLIPLADNHGDRFSRETMDRVETGFTGIANGVSVAGNVKGVWDNEGRVYRDECDEYTVAVQSWRDIAAFLAAVDAARELLRQEAMFVTIAGIPEVL